MTREEKEARQLAKQGLWECRVCGRKNGIELTHCRRCKMRKGIVLSINQVITGEIIRKVG